MESGKTIVAGVDLGGTAVNITFVTENEEFLIEELCEYPSRVADGPETCLRQIEAGLHFAAGRAGVALSDVTAIGLDTPGPASATGDLSARGSTNFTHPRWNGFDVRSGLEDKLGRPVAYLNDGKTAALWGHFAIFGARNRAASISTVIGTGLGGGIIVDGNVIKGRHGFGGELGHVLIPWTKIPRIEDLDPQCNCWRMGDLESLCSVTAIQNSLLPLFLRRNPSHQLADMGNPRQAALMVRGLAQDGDAMCRDIFRVQAQALGLFFDEMINTFDPDVLIVGGGALEAGQEFQSWFIDEVSAMMPIQREEQMDIPIRVMPNGDTAGARGAALEALRSLGGSPVSDRAYSEAHVR
jgi:glucokinase